MPDPHFINPRRSRDVAVARRPRRQWAYPEGPTQSGTRRPPSNAATGKATASSDRRPGPAAGGQSGADRGSGLGGGERRGQAKTGRGAGTGGGEGLIFRGSPRPVRGLFCTLPNPSQTPCRRSRDDRMISLWLADLGVNGLIAKEQRKAERADHRQSRRREKQVRREIDGPVRRREA